MKPEASFAQRLVHWQRLQGRHDLPWQANRDPYRVWLSEIMLQQTQVGTVIAYFDRFLKRFPTVQDLAAASQEDVLGLWSGLGYYSRARNLHRCAQAVVQAHGGAFPRQFDVLQTLPGIGPSTAAAIASLCFEERVAILDGNVKRVLTRVLGFGDDLSVGAHERKLWAHAQNLLPHEHADMPTYTQGIMDLGATVCTPRKPQCEACPMASLCQAHAVGTPEAFPVKTRKIRRTSESLWLLLAVSGQGEVLLQQRPQQGIWAGLYCLPVFESEEALQRALPKKAQSQWVAVPAFKHVLTHKDLYMHPYVVRPASPSTQWPEGEWLAKEAWPALGLPAPVRNLLMSHAT
jgi:A/G-specific adenine glycosylase